MLISSMFSAIKSLSICVSAKIKHVSTLYPSAPPPLQNVFWFAIIDEDKHFLLNSQFPMLLLLLVTFLILFLFHELYWKRRNYPPGPMPVPFIGNILSLYYPPPGYEALGRWTKQYGDVYTFWISNRPYILINSYEKIKETFINDGETYMNKIRQPIQDQIRGGNYGVIETNGEMWRDHRRFALKNLRDFGVGKDLMQEKILIEVEDLFKKFDSSIGEEIEVPIQFSTAIANIINQVVLGYRFGEDRVHEFHELKDLLDTSNKKMTNPKIILQYLIPFTKYILPGKNIDELFEEYRVSLFKYFEEKIENHRKEIDFESEESSDYCEAYLKEQRKREAEGDHETFSNLQLTNMCFDIWIAGLSTTTNTLSWALAYILNSPEVQERIHEELDRVIGSDRIITTKDKSDLPYFNAVLNESQRCLNLIPINLLHETTRDTVINGYPIKQGTGVIAQIGTVMYDEKLFPDPYNFNPDRFMENGKLKKFEEFTPFSIGKRQCPGEGLARMEIFLLLVNFFNRYQLLPSKEGPPSIDKTKDGLIQERAFKGTLRKRET